MIALFTPNIKSVCGRTRIVISLAEEFERKGIEYLIITNKESEANLTVHLKCRFIFIPCNPEVKKIYSILKSAYLLRKVVISDKIKIINSHHRYCELIALVSRIMFHYKIKIFSTVHSLTTDNRFLSYRSNHLIAVSDYIKNHLINYYKISNEKVTTIYNGVTEPDQLESSGDSNNIVLAFGRFEQEKGFEILIKALGMIKKKSEFKLKLIGEGTLEPELKKLAGCLEVNAQYLKSESTPWSEIIKADLIIVPSRVESFGLSIIEAGIMSKCVIAANSGAIPEIIEDGVSGFIFPTEDYTILSHLIEKLMNDKLLRKRIGSQLKESVEKKFSTTIMANSYLQLFNRISN